MENNLVDINNIFSKVLKTLAENNNSTFKYCHIQKPIDDLILPSITFSDNYFDTFHNSSINIPKTDNSFSKSFNDIADKLNITGNLTNNNFSYNFDQFDKYIKLCNYSSLSILELCEFKNISNFIYRYINYYSFKIHSNNPKNSWQKIGIILNTSENIKLIKDIKYTITTDEKYILIKGYNTFNLNNYCNNLFNLYNSFTPVVYSLDDNQFVLKDYYISYIKHLVRNNIKLIKQELDIKTAK